MNLDKILSLIIAFSVILILIFLCFVTQDLYEIWTVINETDTVIKTQQERIKNLEILVLRKMGVGV